MAIDNLVALDKSGTYLYSVINVAKLDGYGDDIRLEVENHVRNATYEYYDHNTLNGCTNYSYESYNFLVNSNILPAKSKQIYRQMWKMEVALKQKTVMDLGVSFKHVHRSHRSFSPINQKA